jgi:hypothetical protein
MRTVNPRVIATWLGLLALLGAARPTSAAAQQEAAAAPGALSEEQLYGSKEEPRTGSSAAPLESADSLSSRVRVARRIAAEQRKAVLARAPSTEGLTESQLEIRAAERNLEAYDLQIARGQGTPAIEAFRKLTLSTLADARRKELWRVWGNALYHPEAFEVLREHARTLAELERIQFLARAKGLSALVTKSEELMRQANLGFERDMQRMRDEVRDNPSFARAGIELRQQAERESAAVDRER